MRSAGQVKVTGYQLTCPAKGFWSALLPNESQKYTSEPTQQQIQEFQKKCKPGATVAINKIFASTPATTAKPVASASDGMSYKDLKGSY